MHVFVCGLSGSGKSTWAKNFAETHKNFTLVQTDDFYLPVYATPNCPAGNWDEPAAFDMEALSNAAAQNERITEGIMAFRALERLLEEDRIKPADVRCVLVETPPETCLKRRMMRKEATPDEETYFRDVVLPMHETHCLRVAERLARDFGVELERVRGHV